MPQREQAWLAGVFMGEQPHQVAGFLLDVRRRGRRAEGAGDLVAQPFGEPAAQAMDFDSDLGFSHAKPRTDRRVRLHVIGGDQGGFIVAQGTPEQVAACKQSITGSYLKNTL